MRISTVSFFEDGSYPGEYYPYGWGLVYYIHNHEDEHSERIYVPIYQDYLKSYKGGSRHDPFERFVEYFVERADVDGVDDFPAFEAHWRAWIEELGLGLEATTIHVRKDRPLGIENALEETYLKTSTTQEKFSVVFPKFCNFI